MTEQIPLINDSWVISRRGKKNPVSGSVPYGWLVEKELQPSGKVEEVAVLFLTNRECPFHCLMCDLWKNTLDQTLGKGLIPAQIAFALNQLPEVKHIKLYNSGSFFDPGAVPLQDYAEIAALLSRVETVTVESHPAFIGNNCLRFKELLKPELRVAIGLEIADDDLLRRLNKKMTTADFARSVKFLSDHGILSRAFVLLKPPFLNEKEGVLLAEQSIGFAFQCGVECCTVIPVRTGNGAMEILQREGLFVPPEIESLEEVLEYGLSLKTGRVFADLWDLKKFSRCDSCFEDKMSRLNYMNHHQCIVERVKCVCIQDGNDNL